MTMTRDKVEIQLFGDTWIDVTGDVYERDPITITRGMPDQGTQADPGRCTLTLDNRDGRYSPRNPMGPYYGEIGRNTPLRVSVPADSAALALTGASTDRASTPYLAAMDAANGVDIRVDCAVDWHATGTRTLAGRALPDSRAWVLRLDSGNLRLEVYDTPSTVRFLARPLPDSIPERATMRAVYTRDTGAGSTLLSLFWGPSMAGPWTSIGTFADALTALNASTAPFEVAPAVVSVTGGELRYPAPGRFYGAQLRNGSGTLLVNVDFSAQVPGSTSFTDSTGLAWTLNGAAEIRGHVDRFVGEVTAWPPKWEPSGADAWTPIEASGILRRLGQGQKPLESTLRRQIPTRPDVLAYWPMEEGTGATQAFSPIPGVKPLKLTTANWAADATLPSSNPLPTLDVQTGVSCDMYGAVPAPVNPAGAWLVRILYRLDTAPTDGPWTMLRVLTNGGTVIDWKIQSNATTSNIIGLDSDGATIVNVSLNTTNSGLWGDWRALELRAIQTATNTVTWRAAWLDVNNGGAIWETTLAGKIGTVRAVTSPVNGYSAGLNSMSIGHIGVLNSSDSAAYVGALDAYAGETALTRMTRLSGEESLPLTVIDGDMTTDSEAVGPQRPNTLLDLLSECADVDSGILMEDRQSLGLFYRDRATLYNQAPKLTLDYSAGQVWDPFDPVDDDSGVTNDVTVTRDGGSSFRAVLSDGPLSVNQFPNGIGAYSTSVTQNLADDSQAESHANWLLHLGTWDEARYPTVTVLLHAAPDLAAAACAVREGDKIRITNLPKWVAPGDVELLVDGYTETLRLDQWEITFNCRPAGPYTVGVADDTVLGRADTDGTTLTDSVTATATTLPTLTPTGPWISSAAYPGDFPFDIQVGGEVCTVTGIVDRPTDDFTRTVSSGWGTTAGGIVWHPAGTSDLSEFSVNGQSGVMTLKSSPGNPRFMQDLDSYSDVEIRVAITPSQLATGDAFLTGVLLRAAGGYYRCRLFLGTDATVGLDLHNSATGRVGSIASTGLTYAAGSKVWFRVRITGQTVTARAWLDGSAEPSTWPLNVTVTTSTIASGAIGLTAGVGTGSTNVNPSFAFDDFDVISPRGLVPQYFTVTRSVNGVSKVHAVGADVRLADPTYVAL